MEPAALVLLQLLPYCSADDRLAPEAGPALSKHAGPVGLPVAEQREQHLDGRPEDEHVAHDPHGEDAQALAATNRPVDVEGDRLVLALLQRVPQEQVSNR